MVGRSVATGCSGGRVGGRATVGVATWAPRDARRAAGWAADGTAIPDTVIGPRSAGSAVGIGAGRFACLAPGGGGGGLEPFGSAGGVGTGAGPTNNGSPLTSWDEGGSGCAFSPVLTT